MHTHEIEQHERFVELYSLNFVGRRQELEFLENHISHNSSGAVMVIGEPGQGKSALLAQFVRICRKKFPDILTIPYFAGIAPHAQKISSLLIHIYRELTNALQQSTKIVPSGLDVFLHHLLSLVRGQDKKTILIVDDVHLLNPEPFTVLMSSFPPGLAENICVIFSTSEADLPIASQIKMERLRLSPFSTEEAQEIIHNLTGKKTDIALDEKCKASPIFLSTVARGMSEFPEKLAWENCSGEFSRLLDHIFNLIEQNCEADSAWPIIPSLLGFIGGANGLYEHDLQKLLADETVDSVEHRKKLQDLPAEITRILAKLQNFLLISPNNGRERIFFRRQIVPVAQRRYLMPQHQKVHQKLAQYFESRFAESGDFSYFQECTYHLRQAGARQKIYEFLVRQRITGNLQRWEQHEQLYISLCHGIQTYVAGTSPEDHFRLCTLILKAGNIFSLARSDIRPAFQWARDGNLEQSLAELDRTSAEDLFLCAIYLLWIEADRQRTLPERSMKEAKLVLSTLDDRFDPDFSPVDWTKTLQIPFMVWWGEKISEIIDDPDLVQIVRKGGDKNSDQVLSALARKLIADGRWQRMLAIAQGIESKQQKSAVLAEAMVALAQTKGPSLELQNRLWEESGQIEYRDRDNAFLALGRMWTETRNAEDYLQFLQKFCENPEESKNDLKQIFILQAMAHTLSEREGPGKIAILKLILQACGIISKDAHKISILSHLAQAVARIDASEKGELLQGVIDGVKALKKFYHRAQLLVEIAQALIKSGDMPQGVRLLKQSQQLISVVEEDAEQNKILSIIIKAITDIADGPEKTDLLQQMAKTIKGLTRHEVQVKAISEIVQVLTDAGNFEDALKAAAAIQEIEHQTLTLTGIAQRLAETGAVERAGQILQEVLATTRAMKNPQEKAAVLSDLVKVATRLPAISKDLLWNAVEESRKIPHDLYKFSALSKIVRSVAMLEDCRTKADLLGIALSITRKIGDAEYKSEVLATYALALLQAGKFPKKAKFWQKLLKSVRKIPNDLYKSSAISQISHTLVQDIALDHAEQGKLLQRLLKSVSKIESSEYRSKILPVIAQAITISDLPHPLQNEFFRQLLKATEKLSDDFSRQYVLLTMGRNLVQSKNFPDRDQLLEQILTTARGSSDTGSTTEFWFTVSHIWAQSRNFSQALQTAEKIEDHGQRVAAILHISQLLIQDVDFPDRDRLLQEALVAARKTGRYWDESAALLEICKNFLTLSNFQHALATVPMIKDSVCRAYAISSIAEASARHSSDPSITQRLLELAGELAEDSEHVKSKALSRVAQVLAQTQPDRALEIAQQIPETKYKARTLLDVAQVLVKAGNDGQAREIFGQALEILHCNVREDIPSDIAVEIVHSLAKSGEFERAMAVVAEVVDPTFYFKAWARLVVAITAVDKGRAMEIFCRMLEELPWARSKAAAILDTIHMLTSAKDLASPEHLARILEIAQFLEDGDKMDVFPQFACLLHQGDVHPEIMENLLYAVKNLALDWDRANTLAAIATELAQKGEVKTALEIVGTIQHDLYRDKTMFHIARATAKLHNWDIAIATAGIIKNAGYKSQAWAEIAIHLAMAGEFDRALAMAEKIPFSTPKTRALSQIGHALKTKNPTRAAEIFSRALATAENAADKSQPLAEVAIAMAQDGELMRSLEITDRIDAENPKREVLRAVSREIAHVGEKEEKRQLLDKVLQIAKSLQNRKYRGEALAAVAEALGTAQEFYEALAVASSIDSEMHQMAALSGIAQLAARSSARDILPKFLSQNALPRQCLRKAMKTWAREVIEYAPDPIGALTNSLTIFPGDSELAIYGVYLLLLAHARRNNWEHYHNIRQALDNWKEEGHRLRP